MAHLEFTQGFHQGKSLPVKGETTLGRAPSNDICLPDSRASREHARISEAEGRFLIHDLGSSNGTYVNGVRLEPGTPRPLAEGDEVLVCSSRALFRAGESRSGTKPASQTASRVPTTGAVAAGDLSVVMQAADEDNPAVSATIDASVNPAEVSEAEQQSDKGLREAVKRLQSMVRISSDLGTLHEQDAVLEKIMERIFDIFPQADRALIMLGDAEQEELLPALGRKRGREADTQEEFVFSRTIINTVIEKRQSILSSDAQKDDRFAMQKSIVDLSIRSMMCAPFIWQDEILGVITVDTSDNLKRFTQEDLHWLTSIAGQAAISIKNAQLYRAVLEEEQKRAHLSRYLSPDVVQGVMDGSIPLELGGKKVRGTVFFCDIVGFTAMSENLPAVAIVDRLNRYFSVTTRIITANRGTLHKFGGDMIMAFWNVMFPDETPERNAIRTSIEMQVAVWCFNLELEAEKQPPIYLGIGCNTGDFAAGNIGGEEGRGSMEYTVIGDAVNLGQRVESLAGRWQVFVAESTYEPAAEECLAVGLPPVMVKGKSIPVKVYSIRGIADGAGGVLLDIPVHLIGPEGNPEGRGILTRSTGAGAERRIELWTPGELATGEELVLEFDAPEFHWHLRLLGEVLETETASVQEGPSFTRATLGKIDGSDDVLSFLEPGAQLESQRTWEEMRRH